VEGSGRGPLEGKKESYCWGSIGLWDVEDPRDGGEVVSLTLQAPFTTRKNASTHVPVSPCGWKD
jgi:hypothetical protein